MALLLFHSPKGGVGNSFLAAHVAMEFASRGFETVAIDFTFQSSLKLFFSLLPDQELVHLDEDDRDEIVVSGVELFDGYRLTRRRAFRELLADRESHPFPRDKIVVADLSSGDRALRDLVIPHADLHICTLEPGPIALAALTRVDRDKPFVELTNTMLVLNMLDDTRTFSRHANIFVRTALGDLLGGTVRYDESVAVAMASFEHLPTAFPRCAALTDVRNLADEIAARCTLPEKQTDPAQ